jgi:hypothetical protein
MKHDHCSDAEKFDARIQELLQRVHRQQHMADEPEVRLMDDIRRTYQAEVDEDARSLERVLSRLVDESAREETRGPVFPHIDQKEERILHMQNATDVLPLGSPRKPRNRWVQRVGVLAATLICVALVGSLSLVLAAMHSKPASSITGSQSLSTNTTTPASPASCQASSDLTEETLCAQGAETNLNITESFTTSIYNTDKGTVIGPGTVDVTFHRAYADVSRLILVYTITKTPGAWGNFVSLTTKQGTLKAMATLGGKGSTSWKGFFTQSFDTTNLPTGTTQIQIESLTAEYVKSGTSVPLAFTLPFHSTASKTVTVQQSVTGKGYTLTLDHVVLTDSLTTFALTLTLPAQHNSPVILLAVLTSDHQQELEKFKNAGVGSPNSYTSNYPFYQSLLLAHPGSSWTVNVSLATEAPASVVLTGTFTFMIPA